MTQPSVLTMVRDVLQGSAQSVGWSKGDIILRRGFFYTHGTTADGLAAAWTKKLNDAKLSFVGDDLRFTILEAEERWMPFKGGAKLQNQSHWRVRLKVDLIRNGEVLV